MKRLDIEFTDDIGGLDPSSQLKCAIGELKTMIAQYGCNTCIDGCVLKYDSAFALDGIIAPTSSNYWQITIDNLTTAVEYPMALQVNGNSQSTEFYQGKNFQVYFTKDSDTTFTIRHEFYIIDDTNGYINEYGVNGFGNWFQNKSAYTTKNNGNTLYDTTKYFTRFLELKGIDDSDVNESLLDYSSVNAKFYDNYETTPTLENLSMDITGDKFVINTPVETIISFDDTFVPTSAKISLINKAPNSVTDDFDVSIIEDSQVATITNANNRYYLTVDLTAKTTGTKEVLLSVYSASEVLSAKLLGLEVVYGCYPTIESRYGDYNDPFLGACIESTPYERIMYGFRVSRTDFNKVDALSPDCFVDGFETYNKVAKLKITKQSDGTLLHESIAVYSGGVWTSIPSIGTGSMTINTTTLWYQFLFEMRNEWIGEYILAEFDLDIFYSTTHVETVRASSLNYILNYDNALASPLIESIELIDPATDSVISSRIENIETLNPSCLDYFKVRICKLDPANEYNIIPALKQSNVSEYDPYTSLVMAQQTNSYFDSVPVDFDGSNCAEFFFDTSTLDKSLSYELVVIIKKV